MEIYQLSILFNPVSLACKEALILAENAKVQYSSTHRFV
jgi:hypothetical protein